VKSKTCTKCGLPKGLDEFNKCAKGRLGRDARCRECKKLVYDDWVARPGNKRRHLSTTRAYRVSVKEFIDSLKTSPCTDCSREFEPFLMEFDHIGRKSITIARVQHQHWGRQRILDELAHCELVCVGCHRLRSASRLPKSIRTDEKYVLVQELKAWPCVACGEAFHPDIMEFDHRDKTNKIANISKMVVSASMISLLAEIQKCDLLCAWCHRRKTHDYADFRTQVATGSGVSSAA
jgi:hypothetical protein